MRPRVLLRLQDIEAAGVAIQEYVREAAQLDYLRTPMMQDAVERQFMIIGEAIRVLLEEAPELRARITNASRIITFRNVLAHEYGAVVDATVWSHIHLNLPLLLAEIRALIAEERARP